MEANVGFNLSKVREVTEKAVVQFPDGSKLNYTFFPNKYTPELEAQIDVAREGGKGGDTLKAWLLPLIHSWDAEYDVPEVDDEGNEIVAEVDGVEGPVYKQVPVPLDDIGMNMMPMEVLGEILTTMIEAMKPGEKKSTNSKGSFS